MSKETANLYTNLLNRKIKVRLKNKLFGTYPMVYHEAGDRRRNARFLGQIIDAILSQPKIKLGCPSNLAIVTWNNYSITPLEIMCHHLGIPLKVYGKNIRVWNNYESKLSLAYQACCDENTEYIMGLDSLDVAILADPKDILDNFISIGLEMLIGAESNAPAEHKKICNDLKNFWDSKPVANLGPFKYLNSGMWIARRRFAKKLFEKALTFSPRKEWPTSDQIILSHTLYYSKNEFYPKLQLDYRCEIFQVIIIKDHDTMFEIQSTKSRKMVPDTRICDLTRFCIKRLSFFEQIEIAIHTVYNNLKIKWQWIKHFSKQPREFSQILKNKVRSNLHYISARIYNLIHPKR